MTDNIEELRTYIHNQKEAKGWFTKLPKSEDFYLQTLRKSDVNKKTRFFKKQNLIFNNCCSGRFLLV